MLKKLFSVTATTLKPKNKTSVLWFAAVPFLAAAAVFSKKAHVQRDNGLKEDLYVFGKKGNPKLAVVTNQTPQKAVKTAAKNYINSNFKT